MSTSTPSLTPPSLLSQPIESNTAVAAVEAEEEEFSEDEESGCCGFCINSVNAARAGSGYDEPATNAPVVLKESDQKADSMIGGAVEEKAGAAGAAGVAGALSEESQDGLRQEVESMKGAGQ